MTEPMYWIVKTAAALLPPRSVRELSFVLLSAIALNAQSTSDDARVKSEMRRLSACHPTFKVTPPPVNLRVVWTQPFDIEPKLEGKDRVSIEFSIQYAQSAPFSTRQEAERAEDFTPNFDLKERNHYAFEGDHLRLLWRESFLNSHWKRQTVNQPEFSCWQTQDNH